MEMVSLIKFQKTVSFQTEIFTKSQQFLTLFNLQLSLTTNVISLNAIRFKNTESQVTRYSSAFRSITVLAHDLMYFS